MKGGSLTFLFNQKLVHFVVMIVVISMVMINIVPRSKAMTINETAGKTIIASLIESEFGSLEEEELVEEFFDYNEYITPVQQSYLDNLSVVKNQPRIINDNFQEEDTIGVKTSDDSAITKKETVATRKASRPRNKIIEHEVGSGETVSSIASKYNISVKTILWENNLSAYSLIRPGDILRILPMTGLSHSVKNGETIGRIAIKYDVKEDEIMEANKLVDASKIAIGQKLLIPGGSKTVIPKPKRSNYTALTAIKDIVKPGNASPAAANKMNWPAGATRITQYYSWRHKGLDIAAPIGTPIYAADSGTVEKAGWGRGYGNNILVNHGGGKKTRYAHLSKFYVKKGDKVEKGETIAAMGSTGWSTGPHLHFEVIINNVKYNPLNYIK